MKPVFVDTNIFIYASGSPHPHKSPSKYLLEKIAKNQIKAVTNSEVLQEVLHRYRAIGELGRGFLVFDDCMQIVPLVLSVSKNDILKARHLLQEYNSIAVRDAIHAAVMLNHGIKTICSYDKHFDQIKEIKRMEP